MSCAIAMIILRKFSACFSSCESVAEAENLESLVTPSTSWATSGPNSSVELLGGGECVLDGVVEEAGDDGGLVQLQLGQQASDLEGMDEVRLTRLA